MSSELRPLANLVDSNLDLIASHPYRPGKFAKLDVDMVSRMEEELVVPSPSAPGFARQLLSDIVDVECRVLYEIMPKSDLTFGMVKSEDGRNRFNIIELWRTREPRYLLAFPVYSALPTEANCERVFSRIGNKT